ncbi:MAG TPA: heavy metal-associated domain-containing protein [Mycobacterium sp.]|nr:heavy-metal-associated domain-containing protein [Mycobacterium sp.]MCB0945370.1 heavy-metal-associated domain-containing protein [Mycobacterium sp.]TXI50232.1 MAG: heavy-metal-associated domain-containing protein [Mycobacterium sp.]HMZ16199.1 heavy metal-associated domain-containing protein [Mycobacterium sp.]HNF07457.1 heavy metal-associated domain-containing protein [Mycobacterium sp.]
MSQTFSVTGLSCQSCVKHVTEAIGALPGVQRVSVDLEPKGASTVHVEAAEPLGDDEVQAALAEEGNYSLLR